MMSAKLATPVLLKINIFLNKGYDIITLDYDVTNKILSMIQIIMKMLSCEQTLLTLTLL